MMAKDPLGTDFAAFYSAGTAARESGVQPAYDQAHLAQVQRHIFGDNAPFYGFWYPPYFLLLAIGLAGFPYLGALLLWLVATGAAYLSSLALLVRGPAKALSSDKRWLLAAAAFPVVFINLTHGQTGFLTAALLTMALATLEKRPLLAGLFFGLLAYKPQLGLMIPLALVAGRQWRAFVVAGVTFVVLAALATARLGWEAWPAFASATDFARIMLIEKGGAGFDKMQSAIAALRLIGAPLAVAYGAQALVTLLAAAMVWRLWRQSNNYVCNAAALVSASLLASPYSFDYDFVALAPAFVLLAADGKNRGFAPWEIFILSACWLVTIAARTVAHTIHLPVGALLPFVLLWLSWQRGFTAAKTTRDSVSKSAACAGGLR